VGALAVTLGGVDALVFTAGVGENARHLRAEVCEGLECVGLHVDSRANEYAEADADIASPDSPSRILILRTRESLALAQETARVLRA
jgi:acetate kinase